MFQKISTLLLFTLMSVLSDSTVNCDVDTLAFLWAGKVLWCLDDLNEIIEALWFLAQTTASFVNAIVCGSGCALCV